MKQTRPERKSLSYVVLIFGLAFALRVAGTSEAPPFDELYHSKRIAFSSVHFPAVLEFDRDRGENGAFCPWPPLYDLSVAALHRLGFDPAWLPPIFFAALAAAISATLVRFGTLASLTAGATVALSPYLIGVSRTGRIDHHYVEPALVLLIILGVKRLGTPLLLAAAITAALMVQPALLMAAGIAFIIIFWLGDARRGAIAFAFASGAILAYRLTRPDAYPNSPWFLGYAHFAALAGAAIACSLRDRVSRTTALAAGIAASVAVPGALPSFISGIGFFGADPWLDSILEFQPMFRDASMIGTDLANLTGGAILVFTLWRSHRSFSLFAIIYLLLAISSRRFLVPAIPLLAMSGAIAAAEASPSWRRAMLMLATVLPPLVYIIGAGLPNTTWAEVRDAGEAMRRLPRGRVLAPWSFGHAIDVIGNKPVLLDNFGSMPDEVAFANANDVLLTTHSAGLLGYCRSRDVKYLALPPPENHLPGVATAVGLDAGAYRRTALAKRTVWWRLYHGLERNDRFVRVHDGPVQIWQIH